MSMSDAVTARAEWRSLRSLASAGLSGVVGMVRDTHGAVTDRVEAALPPAATPVMADQRGVTSRVYAAVDVACRALPVGAATTAALLAEGDPPAPSASPAGRAALAAANGLWGDRIRDQHPVLSVPMAVRVNGSDVPLDAEAVAAAFPDATGDLVVFVHGLAEDDRSWDRQHAASPPYPALLRDEHDLNPVVVRYNSGLRISENGRLLADLIEQLVGVWPIPVRSLSVVGHSMGGLVARSACHSSAANGAAWVSTLTSVVTLGSPHVGAPLEKVVNVADWLLRRLPESEPWSRPLAARSVGVKDLRFGAVVDQDWLGHDPDELLRDRCTEAPLPPHVRTYFVVGTLTDDPDHPLGRVVGDGLVSRSSAGGLGRTRRVAVDSDSAAHLGGAGHLSLLNHPDVSRHLARWLSSERPQGGGTA
jgi:pimeloyl-ACP methyl ester carboxylesterase